MSARRWQADERIIAHYGDGFQRHVAGPLDGPFIVVFEQQRADETNDGIVVGKDADDLGAPLDLAVETFDWIGAVQLRVFRRGILTPLTRFWSEPLGLDQRGASN